MRAPPKISVIIPHYRDLQGLDLCLAAIERQTYPRDRFEVIVADNASPEGEAVVAHTIAGRAHLVVVREKGAGPARNGGISLASGSILAFTDSDCRPEPEWLAEGILALSRHDFVGGRVRVLVDDPLHMTATEAFERVFAFDNKTYVTRKGFTVTANLFCFRTVFEKVGGFNVAVSEDFDWCRRARDAGYRIGYAPTAVVGHPARKTWCHLRSKWKRLNAETFALYATRRFGRLKWLLRSAALPFSAVVHSPRALVSRELTTIDQRLSALVILYRQRLWRFADSLRLFFTRV